MAKLARLEATNPVVIDAFGVHVRYTADAGGVLPDTWQGATLDFPDLATFEAALESLEEQFTHSQLVLLKLARHWKAAGRRNDADFRSRVGADNVASIDMSGLPDAVRI